MGVDRFDVAVIGGGIVGSFTAYFLGRSGLQTCVIERGFPASGTSGATLAWVFSSLKPPVRYALMHKESVALYEQLQRDHGVDFELDRCGSLWVVWDEQEWAEVQSEVEELRAGGIDVELLTPQEAQAMEPVLDAAALLGAAYGKSDGSVNPFLANVIISQLARDMGVAWRNYTQVTGIEASGSGYRLHTSGGYLWAERVVIAAGIWSREIGDMIGFSIPVRPVRGQVLVSAPLEKNLIRRAIGNVFLRQHPRKGNVLLGSTQEYDHDENESTVDGIQAIARRVLKVAPSLGRVPIIRAFSGIRPIPFDGFPLLGEIPGHPGIYTAITHSGFSLAPMVGLVTMEMMTGRPLSFPPAKAYKISRVLEVDDPFASQVKFR